MKALAKIPMRATIRGENWNAEEESSSSELFPSVKKGGGGG